MALRRLLSVLMTKTSHKVNTLALNAITFPLFLLSQRGKPDGEVERWIEDKIWWVNPTRLKKRPESQKK